MRKITMFTNISLDGYFEAPGHDITGFKQDFEAFSMNQEGNVDTILLGHNTYEMMKFWSTPQGQESMPEVARFMNSVLKVVASHQPFDPGWNNVRVISGDVPAQVGQLKAQPGGSIMIFGSNTLCVSLVQEGLINEFQVLVNPVVFGAGTSLFNGLPGKAELELTDTHRFKSGLVMLVYKPALNSAEHAG